jgi:hypothetical protein
MLGESDRADGEREDRVQPQRGTDLASRWRRARERAKSANSFGHERARRIVETMPNE